MLLKEINSEFFPSVKTLLVKQIARKHNVPEKFIKAQLKMGIRVEIEHTKSKQIAREIALDHLGEIPNYYSKLKKMEQTSEKLHESIQKSKSIPKALYGLAAEARKASSFEEFEKMYTLQIKHGVYWHVTDNEHFQIDQNKGPRDMSSVSFSKAALGKLMITSHLENWTDYYGHDRKFAALIDMSNVPKNSYYQVARGFGNEFWVEDPTQARVIAVYPVKKAIRLDRTWQSQLPQSREELYNFYQKIKTNIQ